MTHLSTEKPSGHRRPEHSRKWRLPPAGVVMGIRFMATPWAPGTLPRVSHRVSHFTLQKLHGTGLAPHLQGGPHSGGDLTQPLGRRIEIGTQAL